MATQFSDSYQNSGDTGHHSRKNKEDEILAFLLPQFFDQNVSSLFSIIETNERNITNKV